MQVFKYYFQLAKSLRGILIAFTAVFVFMTILLMMQLPNSATTFVTKKPNIALFNHDSSTFAAGLADYLKANATIMPVNDTESARKEAVYFGTVDAIYLVPANFGDDLFVGKKPQVETNHSAGQGTMQADALVSNYLRLAEPRIAAGMDQQTTVRGIADDVKQQVNVELKSAGNVTEVGKTMYYMNTLVYIVISLSIAVIGSIMLIFQNSMIRRRNAVSALPAKNIAVQLFAGNAVFALGIWLTFTILGCILYPGAMLSPYGALYAVGLFCFVLVSLAIAFMVGSLAKSRRIVPIATNIIGLGMSFLCGVFVPQEILGNSVLTITKALPAYWFVHANGLIAKLTDFSFTNLQPIIIDWLVVLGFAAVLFAITLLLARNKKQS